MNPFLAGGQLWQRRDGRLVNLVPNDDHPGVFSGECWKYSEACRTPEGEYWPMGYQPSGMDLLAYCTPCDARDMVQTVSTSNTASTHMDTFGIHLNATSGYVTKDSGKREEMATGSVRDSREGKGRFELISPFALARIAGVYERGAAKYASRNWEKGQPYSRFLDSALRHMNRFAMGWTDEDHVAQAAWNLLAILHFQELGRTDLDDMPHYQEGPKP